MYFKIKCLQKWFMGNYMTELNIFPIHFESRHKEFKGAQVTVVLESETSISQNKIKLKNWDCNGIHKKK